MIKLGGSSNKLGSGWEVEGDAQKKSTRYSTICSDIDPNFTPNAH